MTVDLSAKLGLVAGLLYKEAIGANARYLARVLNPGAGRPQLQQAGRTLSNWLGRTPVQPAGLAGRYAHVDVAPARAFAPGSTVDTQRVAAALQQRQAAAARPARQPVASGSQLSFTAMNLRARARNPALVQPMEGGGADNTRAWSHQLRTDLEFMSPQDRAVSTRFLQNELRRAPVPTPDRAHSGFLESRNADARLEAMYRGAFGPTRGADQLADQVAMSGRHRPALLAAGDPAAGKVGRGYSGTGPGVAYLDPATGQPHTAFAGFRSASPFMPVRPMQYRGPDWWSAYPDVATGYARFPGANHAATGTAYVAQAPTAALGRIGPASPSFHPHIAADTRGLSAAALAAVPSTGNLGWYQRPHFESVFTAHSPGVLRPDGPVEALYKQLPSGQGFQQVFNRGA